MGFDFQEARFERLVGFCQRVVKIQQTPDLISFVACEKEHVGFCKKIIDPDYNFQRRFAAMCQANQMDPDDICRSMQVVASVLGINKQVDYYSILGVSSDASGSAFKQAYRKKAQILHPDKVAKGAENGEAFIKLQEAYMHLSDPKVRQLCKQSYDGSVYWVEGKKSSKMPKLSFGFDRFLSWTLVVICSVIIVTYAFDIYKNGSVTFFSEQFIQNRLDERELISKNKFDEKSRTKAKKIVTDNIPHPNNDFAHETESEIMVAPRSKTKLDREKEVDIVVASQTRIKSAVFPIQNQTNGDRPVALKDKNQPIKKSVYVKDKLRKKNIKVTPRAIANTSEKTISKVLNKTMIIPKVNKDVFKENKIKEVNYLHEKMRLLTFLENYTNTYEQKDLHRFRTFFVQDALEQGKLFDDLLPTYRQTFNTIEALRYHIDLKSFTIDKSAKKILIEGVFTASYRLPEKDWGNSSGTIRMELSDLAEGLMVSRLEYEMGIR